MKYGENLFGRRDVRPGEAQARPVPAANAPHATPAIVPSPPRTAPASVAADHHPAEAPARVEATMVSRAIQIAETGAFNGKVDVEVAEIRGHFQGEMTARKRLVIHATGRVTGKIRYGKMLVQEGGEMSGDVGTLSETTSHLAALAQKP